jgi:hypothetical protein
VSPGVGSNSQIPPSAIKDKNKSLLRLSRYSQFFIDRSFEFLPEDRVFHQRLHVGLALRETEYRKISATRQCWSKGNEEKIPS